MELCARVHQEAKNWLIYMDCSNAVKTVKRTVVLAMEPLSVPP